MESKRGLVVTRLENENITKNTKDEVKSRIREYFEDPHKYLELDNQIIVGKKPKGPKYDKENKVLPWSVVGGPKIIEEMRPITTNSNNLQTKTNKRGNNYTYYTGMPTRTSLKTQASNYEYIDDVRVNHIFKKANERITKSAGGSQNLFLKQEKFPESSKHEFLKQEKFLDVNKQEEKKSRAVTAYIAKKSKKKEQDLLMNRTDGFRIKKQVIDLMENKKPLDTRYGDNNWVLSLRRENKPKFIRINYINIASVEDPIWKPLIEYPPKDIEIVSRPNSSCQFELKRMMQNKYFKEAATKAEIDVNNMNDLGKMEIKGVSLIKEEAKRAYSVAGKRRLYRQLDAVGDNIKPEVFKQHYDKNVIH